MRVVVSIVVLVLMVWAGAGCRTTPPAPPARVDEPRTEPATPRVPPPSEPPLASPEPAEPLEVLAPPGLPHPARALVVLPIVDPAPTVLFPDEAAAIRRAVARSLARLGHEVVPIADIERIEAAAAEGRLVAEGDRRCRAPLRREDVAARYYAGRTQASVEAVCDLECQLQVSIGSELTYASAKVERPHDVKSWVAAADELSAGVGFIGIGLGISGMGHPPPIRFEPPSGTGPWAQPLDTIDLSAAEIIAAKCAHPDPDLGFGYDVRASVDRAGKVSRCLATPEISAARPADAACVCEALAVVRFGRAPVGRRLRVRAVDDGIFFGSVPLKVLQPGTDAWLHRVEESAVVSRCLNASGPSGVLTADIMLLLAPDGLVTDVRVVGNIDTPGTMQFAACLVRDLRGLSMPCGPPGIERLHAQLVLGAG